MSTESSVVDHIVRKFGDKVWARAMFGEYGVYWGDVFFALICDNRLFLKDTAAGRALLGDEVEEAPPYPGAKLALIVPEDRWEDARFLQAIGSATASALGTSPKKTVVKKAVAKKTTKKTTEKTAVPKAAIKTTASKKSLAKKASPKKR